MKLIHDEYNEYGDGTGYHMHEMSMGIGDLYMGTVEENVGYFFRWVCKLYDESGLIISVVAEESFVTDSTRITPFVMAYNARKSFQTFAAIMEIKMRTYNIFTPLHFEFSEQDAKSYLAHPTPVNSIK